MADKKITNTFNKGLAMDMAKEVTTNTSISDGFNGVILPREDKDFILQNIKGNELKGFLPTNYFPQSIKVFNGIAYIVSKKYDSTGNLEFTEIGTYPSPDWCALFPETIEILDFNPETIDSLNPIMTVDSNGSTSFSGLHKVYSFSVDSILGTELPDPLSHGYYNIFDVSMAGLDESGTVGDGIYNLAYKIHIFDNDGNDKTADYYDHIVFDIIRTEINPDSGKYELGYSRSGTFTKSGITGYTAEEIIKWSNIRENNRLILDDDGNAVFRMIDENTGSIDSEKSYMGEMMMPTHKHGAFYNATIMGIGESGTFNNIWYDVYVLDAGQQPSPHMITFIAKVDKYIKEDIYFTIKTSLKRSDEFDFESCELNTKTGDITAVGNITYNNYNQQYKDIHNASASLQDLAKSKIIYMSHDIELNLDNTFSCNFGYTNNDEKHYLAFKPSAYRNTDEQWKTNYSDSLSEFIDNSSIITTTTNDTDYLRVVEITGDLEESTNDGSYWSQSGDDDSSAFHRIATSEGTILLYELTDLNIDALRIDYGIRPDADDANNNVTLKHIFHNGFLTKDSKLTYQEWPTIDGLSGPSFPKLMNSYARSAYYEYFKDNTAIREWISNDGIFYRAEDTELGSVGLPAWNGASMFENTGVSNDILASVTEYKQYLIDNNIALGVTDFSSVPQNEDKICNIYSCISEGDKVNITVDIDEPCCTEDVKYNVLLHFKLNSSFSFTSDFNMMFSSLYSYLGSIYKEFTITSYQDDIVLLFSNVPSGVLSIELVCDTNNILQVFIDNLDLVNGYYYCLENKTTKLEDKYRPIYNFNSNETINDIYLQDSMNFNEPFRSKSLLDDTRKDAELEIQPNYDSTVNLIINDKSSKVKFINSRFAFNPSSLECFIPQKFDYNDDNIYSEKYINFTELIRRDIKNLDVEFVELQKGGELNGGSNVYYFRYVDSDGNTTDISGHTLPIPVYNIEDQNNKILGIEAGKKTNTAVKIELSGFDRAFKQIELSYVYNAGELNNTQKFFKLTKLFNIPLADKLIVIHTGLEGEVSIPRSEIGKYYNHHKSVNSLTQSKNRLVLSNHKLSDVSVYQEIKRLALNMTIEEEVVKFEGKDTLYKDAYNVHYYTGHWRGETYQIGVELDLIMGGKTTVFHPRGIDNIDGNKVYTATTSINEFKGQFGENPYGIYRTQKDTSIMNVNTTTSASHDTYVVALRLIGLKEFLEHPVVKSIAKGFTIVRKDRIKDTIMQGFTSPVLRVPFGSGMIPIPSSDTVEGDINNMHHFDADNPYIDFNSNIENTTVFTPNCVNATDTDTQYKYNIMPFGLMQVYSANQPYDPTIVDPAVPLNGYPAGDIENKAEIEITNLLVRQDSSIDNKFGFISGDLFADAEHIAPSFKGKGKYFDVSRSITYFSNENSKIGTAYNIINGSNTDKAISYLESGINNGSRLLSGNTESFYIPELTDSSTPDFFSSKIDQSNLNLQALSFIGVTEEEGNISNLLEDISINTENPYGFLTNVYSRDTGILSHSEWVKVYSSRYNEGGYFPVMTVQKLDKPLEDIFWNNSDTDNLMFYGGDCFINKTYLRVLNKVGLTGNFDSYSSIWNYVGEPDSVDYMEKPFNEDDIASNSWFKDNIYMALKRSRLIPKGMWVEVAHESNFNLTMRSEDFKSPDEMAIYNKDRTFLISKDKVKSYISNEFNSSQLESKSYNRGYSYNSGMVYNFSTKDLEKLLRVFYTRVEASDIAVRGELKNGYREMYGLNHKDYDTKYGSITKVITGSDITYCIFEKGTALIPIAEKQMVSEANGGVYIAMNEILGVRLTQVSENYGSIHPDSCITTETGIYFFDHNNLAIIQTKGQQSRDISSHKIEKFLFGFKNKLKEIREDFPELYFEYNVKTNYNILNGNITFTFYIIEKRNKVVDECGIEETPFTPSHNDDGEVALGLITLPTVTVNTIVNESCNEQAVTEVPKNIVDDNKIIYSTSIYYNERQTYWVNRLTFDPNFEFSLRDNTFNTNLIYNENRIYVEDSNNVNYCFFFDKQHSFSFEFVINQAQMVQTIINNLQVVSNQIIPITLSIDVEEKKEMHDLSTYSLDLKQNITTRRHEIKIISLEVSGVHKFFLNVSNPYLHTITAYQTFSITGTDYRVVSITDTLTDDGVTMPMLEIEYFDGSWINLDTIIGEDIYNQVYGYIFLISKIKISRANSDYNEDHLYIQVQKVDGRRVRDKVFRIRMDYDGINHTYVQAILSSVELSYS